MPKVSVIIPVYNAEEYLERCLDSVCNQTLKDIEVICVDDCSTDNSLCILNEYADRYPHIKVFKHEVNGGESKARNTGLNHAIGDYIGFVDNDDVIDVDFYEKLYKKALETSADIIKGNSKEINYENQTKITIYNKIIKQSNHDRFCFTTHWWTAIYKASLIKESNITFPEDNTLGGDVLFLNKALLAASQFAMIDDTFYNYYRRIDSGDSLRLSLNKTQSAMKIYLQVIKNLSENYPKIVTKIGYDFAIKYYINGLYQFLYRNKQESSRRFVLQIIYDIYENIKNKEVIDNHLFEYNSHILYFLKTNNKDAFLNFVKSHEKEDITITEKLKYRILLNKFLKETM